MGRLGKLRGMKLLAMDWIVGSILILAIGVSAWSQDGSVIPASGSIVLGWDFVALSLATLGVMEGSKKLLPDALEVKWLPIISHAWSLIGTAIVAALFHKLPGSWAAVLPLLGQAAAQAIMASGLRTQGWNSAPILTGSVSKTLGDSK